MHIDIFSSDYISYIKMGPITGLNNLAKGFLT